MGQGPSSVDFNYIYSNSDNSLKQKKLSDKESLKGFSNKEDLASFSSMNSDLKEILFTLKYHTNMMSIDKNFVLKNKKINEKLDKKIDETKKQIQKIKQKNLSDTEKHNQLAGEFTNSQTYVVVLKYSNIFLFIIFVLLLSFYVLRNKSNKSFLVKKTA